MEDLEAKRALDSTHLFFSPAPFAILNLLHRTLLRPLWLPFRWWVKRRPVVVIRRGA